jgi:hypothetical protein
MAKAVETSPRSGVAGGLCRPRSSCRGGDGASSSMVVFALAAVAESGDQFEHRVKRGLERLGVAFDLSEQQAAL